MMSCNYADYQSGQLVYTDWQQPYQFYAAQQPPTHDQYVSARSWQQDRASFDQLDRYPPQLDPDPPDSVDWWQPYHPYNQSTPAARQPHAYQPQTQTFITPFGQQISIDIDPIVHQRNPDAGYHQGQPEYQPPRTPSHCSDFYGQRRTHHEGYHPWQPSYHLAGQPLQFDQSLSHRTAPLPAAVPPQSGSTHLPLQARKFTDSEQQRDLPNIPSLNVRSLSPAQLAAVNDYNEKLRVYRLDQAALLARVTARFEENIDDKNLAEDVPDNVAHNGGVNLDVPNNVSLEEVPNDESLEEIVKPNDESLEEIVKTDNMPPQVLVGAYDGKFGDLIVPEHRELEIQDDIKTFVEENVVCYEDFAVLITSLFDRNIGATQINSKSSRSHIMFTGVIESWCRSSLQSSIRYQQRRLKFDPGGEASVIDHLHCFVISTLRTRWLSTVGELIREYLQEYPQISLI